MHIFLDKFHQGGKYSAQIASHQAELRIEGNSTDQKSLFISYLQTDYLNINSILCCGRNSERANTFQTKCTFCGGANNSAETNSEGLDRKRNNLLRMVIRTTYEQNVRLEK